MSVAALAIVLLVVAGLAAWLLRPGRPGAPPAARTPDEANEAHEEHEELAGLYAAMAELEDEVARGELDPAERDRLRQRYEQRSARQLGRIRRLQSLPATPRTTPRRASLTSSLAVLAGLSLAAVAVGGFALPRVVGQTVTVNDPRLIAAGREILELERLAKREPTEANLLALARKAWDWQAYDKAAAAYVRLVELNPRQPEALRRFGILLLGSERFDEALGALSASVRLDPSSSEAYRYLGQALYQGKQDPAGAVKAWTVYRKLEGDRADPQVLALLEAAQAELAATPGAAPGLVAGARLYAASCAVCHGAAGAGGPGGPALRRRVTTTQDARVFAAIVREGRGRMPGLGLPDAEIAALFAYVKSLGTEP